MSVEKYLSRKDKILGQAIKSIKLTSFKPERNYFRALVLSIISQQLSISAADTIAYRFTATFKPKKFPTPADVLKTPPSRLRAAGLSRAKAVYIKDLARNFQQNKIDIQKLKYWSDEEVISHLTTVKGIGRWTAEMFLIFTLDRPDVFSVGDLGLRNAIKKLYKLKDNATALDYNKIAEAWSPYRSTACRYLWKTAD
jgi:DNA-3-methyladenine glycosylase II